jgi:hypothetical protein
MNPQQARERVAETFPQPFNRAKFLEFSRNLLNKFLTSRADALHNPGAPICKRSAIHFTVTAVSRRNRTAIATFPRISFRLGVCVPCAQGCLATRQYVNPAVFGEMPMSFGPRPK